MRILVDTNVFLDHFLARGDDGLVATKFFAWCFFSKNQIYVASSSLRDIEYVAMRHFHNHLEARKVTLATYSLCAKVIGISADSAIESLFSDNHDYEDECLIQAAKEQLLDAIVTNNIKDFSNSGIPCFKPKELMDNSNSKHTKLG